MNSKTESRPALDRSDERVQHNDGLFGVVRAQINRIKTGDLGTAPVIAGLIVISLVFTCSTRYLLRRITWLTCFLTAPP
ncbi:Uncharacterised protein [Raoultella terrigena]|uniref:Uncharacterized protein n=1 Tax=Raoultella terrigena TaxID=577 RepID=A0A4U9D662_RAOTE|nr:Uncharacterised protein [Raoultella terrigena]